MKILITGGCGFIGSQLTQYLREDEHEVVIYDSFLNFSKSQLYLKALEQRRELLMDTKIISGDIRDRIHFREVLELEKPEVVVHLAAVAVTSPRGQYNDSVVDINLNGTIIVAEECSKAPSVRRLISTSSSMAYGNFPYFCPKEDSYLMPLDTYGASKAAGEMFVRHYMFNTDKEYIIMRPSAVYGPRDSDHRVVEIFVQAGLKGKDSITATNWEKLDFTFIEDIATAFRLAVTTENANQVYNVTTGEEHTIVELAHMVQEYFPKLQIIEKDKEGKSPERGQLDISKARKLLGFNPKYTLKTGLEKYIKFELENG